MHLICWWSNEGCDIWMQAVGVVVVVRGVGGTTCSSSIVSTNRINRRYGVSGEKLKTYRKLSCWKRNGPTHLTQRSLRNSRPSSHSDWEHKLNAARNVVWNVQDCSNTGTSIRLPELRTWNHFIPYTDRLQHFNTSSSIWVWLRRWNLVSRPELKLMHGSRHRGKC